MQEEKKNLSDEQLAEHFQMGDAEAQDVLMDRYKYYVRSLAHARFLVGGETDDLIQEGMIGLMKALRDYRSDKGASFKTFATMCIVRQQTTAIENASRQKNKPLNDSVSLSGEELETALFYMRHPSPEDILLDKESEKE
ncbi:MAG: sigma-70 family RNA polymerase sigma factor, partial [Lachnospiraceae bacterium]|nr:sigma-70 family RNA polymerase sigma factor [Candidatus Equihabitans merdae]